MNTQVCRMMSLSLCGSIFALNVTEANFFHRCVCVEFCTLHMEESETWKYTCRSRALSLSLSFSTSACERACVPARESVYVCAYACVCASVILIVFVYL